MTNTSEQIITLDGTVCSAISKLEVYCGSNLLVSVKEYGALFSVLYDTQAPSTHRSTMGKLLGVSDTARMGEPATRCAPWLSGHSSMLCGKVGSMADLGVLAHS